MDALCNFHTHKSVNLPNQRELISTPLAALRDSGSETVVRSLELHPWKLPERFRPLGETFNRMAMFLPVIGECGLDKLRGPELSTQILFLEAIFDLAEVNRKPVVLHIVRASAEFLGILKRKKVTVPLLWHNFRGSAGLLQQMLKIPTLSFSFTQTGIFEPYLPDCLTKNPQLLTRIGLETDDAEVDLARIYQAAATFWKIPQEKLTEQMTENFETFTRYGRGSNI